MQSWFEDNFGTNFLCRFIHGLFSFVPFLFVFAGRVIFLPCTFLNIIVNRSVSISTSFAPSPYLIPINTLTDCWLLIIEKCCTKKVNPYYYRPAALSSENFIICIYDHQPADLCLPKLQYMNLFKEPNLIVN